MRKEDVDIITTTQGSSVGSIGSASVSTSGTDQNKGAEGSGATLAGRGTQRTEASAVADTALPSAGEPFFVDIHQVGNSGSDKLG
jgi:hypothetical protein